MKEALGSPGTFVFVAECFGRYMVDHGSGPWYSNIEYRCFLYLSVVGVVTIGWAIYFICGYLDPWGLGCFQTSRAHALLDSFELCSVKELHKFLF